MSSEYNWQYDLEEYIKQGEPERAEKSYAWQIAIGLQDVDGLKTSDYLLDNMAVYKKVLSGELRKFPKNFFMNAKNAENIRICLRYAIRENLSFSSVEELYDFFSNESQAVNFLRKVKLYSVYKDFFHTPVQMLHESLAESQKNEWLYRCGSWKTYMNKNKMLKKRKKDGKTFYTLCTRKEEIHAGSDTK